MSKMIDLSMPVWDGAGYGEVLAMPNTPVRFFEYMTYDVNGLRRTALKFDDETGSPFMTIWQKAPHAKVPLTEGGRYTWHLDEVPLDRYVVRPTAVLDVPKGPGEVITGDDIDAAVAAADYREGDEVLVRTGWATTEKAYEMGPQFVLDGPSWSYEACVRMAVAAEARTTGIVMTDAPLIMTPAFQGWRWTTGPHRIVPMPRPWPSIEARDRQMDLPPGAIRPADIPEELGKGGYRELMRQTIAICKCLVNADQITQPRVTMVIVPLLVRQGGAAPCRFVAIED